MIRTRTQTFREGEAPAEPSLDPNGSAGASPSQGNRKGARRHGISFEADDLSIRWIPCLADGVRCRWPRPDGDDDGPPTNGHERRHDGAIQSEPGTESDTGIGNQLELDEQHLWQPGLWLSGLRRRVFGLFRQFPIALFWWRQLLLEFIPPPACLRR